MNNSFGVNSQKHVILGDLMQNKRWFLLRECHFFLFLPPENEFLQKF